MFGCDQYEGGFNFVKYCNPELDKINAKAKRTFDQAARAELLILLLARIAPAPAEAAPVEAAAVVALNPQFLAVHAALSNDPAVIVLATAALALMLLVLGAAGAAAALSVWFLIFYAIGKFGLLIGDCRELLRTLPDASVDSIVTDPPYHLTNNGGGPHGKGVDNPYSH